MGLFSAVGVNSRKRGREGVDATFPTLPTTNIFSLQHQRSSQALISTALALDINGQKGHQQHGHILPFSTFSSFIKEDLADQFKEQSNQIDEIIKTHGDQLQRTLAEQYRRHYRALQGAAEESVAKRLREKDVELEKGVRRNTELEQRVARLIMEAQVWREKARALEGTTLALRKALQKAMVLRGSSEEGEKLWCEVGEDAQALVEDAESSHVDPERVGLVELACKACRKRAASVMMWPCRHVCVCMKCDAAIKTCPMCQAHKTNSVEVYLS